MANNTGNERGNYIQRLPTDNADYSDASSMGLVASEDYALYGGLPRVGTVTRGKRIGINYLIKAL